MTVREFAPAKVNLSLHVTGQRPDGYHLLDSLVVFVEIGDWVSLTPAAETGLAVVGPQSTGVPVDGRNLVIKAAALYPKTNVEITLEKHLPPASGIGGGSADAAATLRALSRLSDSEAPTASSVLSLGADVPVCLAGQPCRMQGIGDEITPLPALPDCQFVLVNPRVEVATPDVFKALPRKDNTPMPALVPAFTSFKNLLGFLAQQRNDLEAPAISLQPVIADVLHTLRGTQGCGLVRMSGSGATCFGIFPTHSAAEKAAKAIAAVHPDWWVAQGAMRKA